jgi:hypothetical protein
MAKKPKAPRPYPDLRLTLEVELPRKLLRSSHMPLKADRGTFFYRQAHTLPPERHYGRMTTRDKMV